MLFVTTDYSALTRFCRRKGTVYLIVGFMVKKRQWYRIFSQYSSVETSEASFHQWRTHLLSLKSRIVNDSIITETTHKSFRLL